MNVLDNYEKRGILRTLRTLRCQKTVSGRKAEHLVFVHTLIRFPDRISLSGKQFFQQKKKEKNSQLKDAVAYQHEMYIFEFST